MKNTFGSSVSLTLFGESHGPEIGAVLDGLAPGIEIREDASRFVRSNPSYREFVRRYFGIEMRTAKQDFVKYRTPFMRNIADKCGEPGGKTFYDEKLPDGSVVHYFARWIGRNPKTGDIAVAVAVLSISDPEKD